MFRPMLHDCFRVTAEASTGPLQRSSRVLLRVPSVAASDPSPSTLASTATTQEEKKQEDAVASPRQDSDDKPANAEASTALTSLSKVRASWVVDSEPPAFVLHAFEKSLEAALAAFTSYSTPRCSCKCLLQVLSLLCFCFLFCSCFFAQAFIFERVFCKKSQDAPGLCADQGFGDVLVDLPGGESKLYVKMDAYAWVRKYCFNGASCSQMLM